MIKTVINNAIEMAKTNKISLFKNLIRSNSGVSSKNFFLVITTLIGAFLLLVLIGGFIVDIIYNHTISVDMNGAAVYIGAVASLFASAGLTKAWSDSSANKYIAQHPQDYRQPKTQEEADEELIPCEDDENI